MGNARICVCGHTTTDHKYQYNTMKRWGACDWYNCDCSEFVFEKETPAKITRFTEEIPKTRTRKMYQKQFTLDDVDEHGILTNSALQRFYAQKNKNFKFDNGEYP